MKLLKYYKKIFCFVLILCSCSIKHTRHIVFDLKKLTIKTLEDDIFIKNAFITVDKDTLIAANLSGKENHIELIKFCPEIKDLKKYAVPNEFENEYFLSVQAIDEKGEKYSFTLFFDLEDNDKKRITSIGKA